MSRGMTVGDIMPKLPDATNTADSFECVLASMVSAMVDPIMSKTLSALGGNIRKQVLLRALKAAQDKGWKLTKIDVEGRL